MCYDCGCARPAQFHDDEGMPGGTAAAATDQSRDHMLTSQRLHWPRAFIDTANQVLAPIVTPAVLTPLPGERATKGD